MAPEKLKSNESLSTAAGQDDSSPAKKQKTSDDAVSPSEVVPIQKPATQCAPFIPGECEKVLHVEFGPNTFTKKGY